MTESTPAARNNRVKVKAFRFPRLVVATWAQGRTVLRGFGHMAWRHKTAAVAAASVALVLVALIMPRDPGLLRSLHFWKHRPEEMAQSIAYALGTWGDYPTYNLPLALIIWGYGVWKKKKTGLAARGRGLFPRCDARRIVR